ncbi:MAG: LemA family protein [Candidatus Zixiibacteriota bacterium]
MLPTLLILGFIVVIGIMVATMYNKLVMLKNRAENAWSDIDVQLRRRYDLIPNLVETVKGYATHEKETLENVIKARQQAISVDSIKDQGKMENMLTGALRQLFAVAESYPDLKANQNFLELQNSLTQIEDQIQQARRYYNAIVRDLNTATEKFPSNIIANMFSFQRREYFEIEEPKARENVKVKF